MRGGSPPSYLPAPSTGPGNGLSRAAMYGRRPFDASCLVGLLGRGGDGDVCVCVLWAAGSCFSPAPPPS